MNFLRVNAPYITLPFAAVVGIIGYNIEGLVSDRYTPFKKSVEEQREERMLKELEMKTDAKQVDSLKEKKFVPQTIFERNVSPSLQVPKSWYGILKHCIQFIDSSVDYIYWFVKLVLKLLGNVLKKKETFCK